MLEGLLKSKFYSKCKSDIKQTRTRIEMIKKKRNAVQKYLKNDVADLLKNDLDFNASGRAEGLLIEMNRSSCFELIEQFCVQILENLATMDKQMECPKQCREAVSSLMFAAARFAELPELRELRSIFSQRYSNTLDFYVNTQLMEKSKSCHPSKEMKIQLLRDIAAESGIEWNSKALENKMYHESACKKDSKGDDYSDKVFVARDSTDGLILKNEFKGGTEYKRNNQKEYTAPDRRGGLPYYRHKCRTEDRLPSKTENGAMRKDVLIKNIQVDTIKRNETLNQPDSPDPNEEKEEEQSPKYRPIPPPYVKSYAKTKVNLKDPIGAEKVEPTETSDDHAGSEKSHNQDNTIGKSKPKTKSVRRRHLKTPSAHESSIHSESEKLKDVSRAQEAEQCRRVLKFLDLDCPDQQDNELDEEEKIMDRLLLHYSRKKAPSGTDNSYSDVKLSPHHADGDSSRATRRRSIDGPNRATSLPRELNSPTKETPKRHTRASSFQPGMLNGNGHVHPKLPDYDDFVARLAALGRK